MVRCHIAGVYLFCVHWLCIYSIQISQKFRFPKMVRSYSMLFSTKFSTHTCESANMNMCNVSPGTVKSECVITNTELGHFNRGEIRLSTLEG